MMGSVSARPLPCPAHLEIQQRLESSACSASDVRFPSGVKPTSRAACPAPAHGASAAAAEISRRATPGLRFRAAPCKPHRRQISSNRRWGTVAGVFAARLPRSAPLGIPRCCAARAGPGAGPDISFRARQLVTPVPRPHCSGRAYVNAAIDPRGCVGVPMSLQ